LDADNSKEYSQFPDKIFTKGKKFKII